MEKIFTENGIPTNYVKLYYPDDNYLYSVFDERKTRMYISAEMQHFNNLELKCEEPTSEKEVILYGIWVDTNKNKGNKPSGVKKNDVKEPDRKLDEESGKEEKNDNDDDNDKGEECGEDKYGNCFDDGSLTLRISNLSLLLFICLVLI